MSEFNVGDRVRIAAQSRHIGAGNLIGEVGVVQSPGSMQFPDETRVLLDSTGRSYYFETSVLEFETPKYVNVTTSRSIWVTLPGDNAGHRLTEDEARALFRQLEEIL